MKKIHTSNIPDKIKREIPYKTFSLKWREIVKAFLKRIENEIFKEPVAVKMAIFLKSKSVGILKLIERAEKLMITIQKQLLKYVLCRTDIHG